MNEVLESLHFISNKNLEYGEKLVSDLSNEQMILQPADEMNHPAWLLSHLNAYHPIITAILLGESFDDPKEHKFGMNSRPENDSSVYLASSELIEQFRSGHRSVADALQKSDPAILSEAIQLERWRVKMNNNLTILTYLIALHENQHLGQLSAWRRAQRLPRI